MRLKRYGLIGLMLFCIVAGVLLAYGYRVFLTTGVQKGSEARSGHLLPKLAKVKTHLYFLDENYRFLRAEERSLVRQDSAVERARSIVDALIEGPEGELLPTLPPETKLLSLYVTQDGVAYADFDRAISENHSGGTLSELFTVFSVVNTLALNIQEIEAVKILIEGREAKTLAGHIDIRFPFRPDILMIK
jgi:spore germination protein GerM